MAKTERSITAEWTRKIKTARDALQVASAEATEAQARLDNMVVKALNSVQAPLNTSVICLDCGGVRPAQKPETHCPFCNPA